MCPELLGARRGRPARAKGSPGAPNTCADHLPAKFAAFALDRADSIFCPKNCALWPKIASYFILILGGEGAEARAFFSNALLI